MSTSGFDSIDDLLGHNARLSKDESATSGTQKVVDSDALSVSSTAQEHLNTKMEEIRLKTVEDEVSTRARSKGIPYIDLVGFPIGPEILTMIPEEDSKAYQVISFFSLEDQIRVGLVDEESVEAMKVVEKLKRKHENSNVSMYLISQNSFEQAFKLYKNVAKVKAVEYGVHISPADLERFQKELDSYETFEKRLIDAEGNMTEAFAMIISMAMNAGTSDIHIEAAEQQVIIRFRIDGVLTEIARIPITMQQRLVHRIKNIAGLKINVETIPQDGRITIEMGEDDTLDIRVSTLPSAFGESIVFRLLQSSSVGLSFDDLGMRPLVYARLKEEIFKPNGMIITTGPTGSGKTTTLYAILNTLNSPANKIITLENPVEYKLAGIVQSQIDPSKDYTFALGLRAILRQDPDIVMVGEIRDLETAETSITAALTGHLMLSTIHTNDAAGVVPRLLSMGVQNKLLAPSMNAVIGQRLVRRIHEECKEVYTPTAEELAKFSAWIAAIPESSGEILPDPKQTTFYKGKGCEGCRDTGYKGRVGIYEVFTMIPEIEMQILSEQLSEYQMKGILHASGMVTMGQDGMLKAAEGITTLEEVLRVTKE